LAVALREAFQAADMPWRSVREVPGQGLEGFEGDGVCWRLGTAAWAGNEAGDRSAATQSVLSRNGVPLARFIFDERLRDDAVAAVQALQNDGVRVRLLSGDVRPVRKPSRRPSASHRRAAR
jgi:Cu2+-exporting ATPase